MLRRSESDGVMMEDVDALQLELEAMLAATVVKKRTIAHEVDLIEGLERRGGGGAASSSKVCYALYANTAATWFRFPESPRTRDVKCH